MSYPTHDAPLETPLEFNARMVSHIRASIAAYVEGSQKMTALELYYSLERATPVLWFHTLLREGARNQLSSGLQQSYGDHIRLLVHAIDRLVDRDVSWFRARSNAEVDEEALTSCIALFDGLKLTRHRSVVLWLSAALHDYGKLRRLRSTLDAEEAGVMALPLLEALIVDRSDLDLALFCIRNHDAIEHIASGETAAAFISEQLDTLPHDLRPTAMAFLGIIQLAGEASLGMGRLSARRVSICRECFNGSLVRATEEQRLMRLIRSGDVVSRPDATSEATQFLTSIPADELTGVRLFLGKVNLHGWTKHIRSDSRFSSPESHWSLLCALIRAWTAHVPDVIHVVVDSGSLECLSEWKSHPNGRLPKNYTRLIKLKNGTSAAYLAQHQEAPLRSSP